jgi:hypothetical protein
LQRMILVYFMNIWSILQPFDTGILWTFGIFCGNLVLISPFWFIVPRKIWQPWSSTGFSTRFFFLHREHGPCSHPSSAWVNNAQWDK